ISGGEAADGAAHGLDHAAAGVEGGAAVPGGPGAAALHGLGVVRAAAAVAGSVAQFDELPLLVGAVQVVPLRDPGAVGGGPFPDFQGLAAVAVDQPDVAVVGVDEAELLVPAVEVGPWDGLGAAVGVPLVGVEALAAVAGVAPGVPVAAADGVPLALVVATAVP